MKKKIFNSLFIALGVSTLAITTASAQSINQRQDNPFPSNEQNPLYGDGINPMQLIHNATMMNRRNSSAFNEDSNRSIDNAAKNFRQQQQQRIMEMQQNQKTDTQIEL